MGEAAASHGLGAGVDPPTAQARAARRPWLSQALALAAITATAPAMLLAAGATLAALGRPVLFVEVRSGLRGAPFDIVKFRSMHDLRDPDGNPLPDDARRTPVGDLLRRLRLDELPQLFAVVSGRMAFVGPRPLRPETVAGYGRLGEVRGSVRPGLTGWAQVNGNARLCDDDKLALDVWYVDHRGPLLDLRILVETALVVVAGERIRADRLAIARAHVAASAGATP